jgi:integrase|tara:strand:- start:1802 stop:2356 length:555 start_codon:yes stop_codon:yes gene_type:complete
MSKKGDITTSNYIDFDKASAIGSRLIKGGKDKTFGLYIIVAINTGLRIGDILKMSGKELFNGSKTFREEKTNKAKTVLFNDAIKNALSTFDLTDESIFKSQKGTVFSRQQINRKIKKHFKQPADKNYSSHSLRKSFGRRVYENNDQSEKALMYLSELYNHSSLKITRGYLDITQEELNDVYMNL